MLAISMVDTNQPNPVNETDDLFDSVSCSLCKSCKANLGYKSDLLCQQTLTVKHPSAVLKKNLPKGNQEQHANSRQCRLGMVKQKLTNSTTVNSIHNSIQILPRARNALETLEEEASSFILDQNYPTLICVICSVSRQRGSNRII